MNIPSEENDPTAEGLQRNPCCLKNYPMQSEQQKMGLQCCFKKCRRDVDGLQSPGKSNKRRNGFSEKQGNANQNQQPWEIGAANVGNLRAALVAAKERVCVCVCE